MIFYPPIRSNRRTYKQSRGGRVVRRCGVIFRCRGVLLIWITVGQGPIVLAVGAGGGCLDIFSLIYHLSILSPSLWETARSRLKYCLKGPLSLKQPTNKQTIHPYFRRPFVYPSIHPSPYTALSPCGRFQHVQ